MKKHIGLLIMSVYIININSQTTSIPDPNFEQVLINLGYDTGVPDGTVPTANIDTVTYLNVGGTNISSLVGIEGFISLQYLRCYSHLITTLDLTANLALTTLDVRNNELTSLNITANTLLESLNVGNNYNLTSIDLSNNTQLKYLDAGDINLTSLDITNNNMLEIVEVGISPITTLDLTQNPLLKELRADNCSLTALDVSLIPLLEILSLSNNDIAVIDLSQNPKLFALSLVGNNLTELDLSQNPLITTCVAYINQLTCLNLKGINVDSIVNLNVSLNPNLGCIEVDAADISWFQSQDLANMFHAGVTFSADCNNACSNEALSIENNKFDEIIIYPNPSKTGIFQMKGTAPLTKVKIFTIEGRLVDCIQKENIIDLSKHKKGVYILKSNRETVKLIYTD